LHGVDALALFYDDLQDVMPMSSLRNLMQCEDVGSVAWFVHECMERVDNSHAG
jgi:hypothetical protein